MQWSALAQWMEVVTLINVIHLLTGLNQIRLISFIFTAVCPLQYFPLGVLMFIQVLINPCIAVQSNQHLLEKLFLNISMDTCIVVLNRGIWSCTAYYNILLHKHLGPLPAFSLPALRSCAQIGSQEMRKKQRVLYIRSTQERRWIAMKLMYTLQVIPVPLLPKWSSASSKSPCSQVLTCKHL